jgi:tRNA U34 5-carboxymethylaminomethyl modifying GTPase MnmE/TrmE
LLCSAETGQGIPALRTAILSALGLADIDPAAPAAFTQRQADLLTRAAEALSAEPQRAEVYLQRLLGR